MEEEAEMQKKKKKRKEKKKKKKKKKGPEIACQFRRWDTCRVSCQGARQRPWELSCW